MELINKSDTTSELPVEYLSAIKRAGERLCIKNKKLIAIHDNEMRIAINTLRANNPSIDPKEIQTDLNAIITPINQMTEVIPKVNSTIKEKVQITIPLYKKPTRSDMAVLLVYFNACEYKKLAQNCTLIYQTLVRSHIPVFLVEHCFKDQVPLFPENGTTIFNTRSESYMFYKENLINWLIPKIPEQYTKFCMMDADLLFEKDTWYDDVSTLLDTHDILQPFQEAIYLDSDLKSINMKSISISYKYTYNINVNGHCGFTWAARRNFFQPIGFFDLDVFCNADILFAWSLFKLNDKMKDAKLLRIIKCNIPDYNEYCLKFNNPRTTCYPQTIYHLWHGSKSNRHYGNRYTEIHNITKDIQSKDELFEINSYGVYEYNIKYRDELNTVILNYFKRRNEDGI